MIYVGWVRRFLPAPNTMWLNTTWNAG